MANENTKFKLQLTEDERDLWVEFINSDLYSIVVKVLYNDLLKDIKNNLHSISLDGSEEKDKLLIAKKLQAQGAEHLIKLFIELKGK